MGAAPLLGAASLVGVAPPLGAAPLLSVAPLLVELEVEPLLVVEGDVLILSPV